MGTLGDRQIYRAIYTNKNGLLPYGSEVQFVNDKYKIEKWHFDKPLDRNFKDDIIAACKRAYGIDVSHEFMPGSHPFRVESITYRQKQVSSATAGKENNHGCFVALRVILRKLLIVVIGIIVIIVAAAIISAIYD